MNDLEILEQNAIDAAMSLHWDDAIEFNKKILKIDKMNIGAQLRLGFIYLQNNELEVAKKHYKAALKIQPSSPLAHENLEKIAVLLGTGTTKPAEKNINFNPNLFLEIPGKTKSVALVNIGQKNILAQATIGEEIYLKTKKRKLEIRTKTGEFLGYLPDDLSKRMFLFLKGGSHYKAFIKEVSLSKVVIFIREEKRGKRVMRFSSFPRNTMGSLSKIAQGAAGTGAHDDDHHDAEDDEFVGNDLDRLAETLTHEEKEYLPYAQEEEEDENNEE